MLNQYNAINSHQKYNASHLEKTECLDLSLWISTRCKTIKCWNLCIALPKKVDLADHTLVYNYVHQIKATYGLY